MTVWRPRRRSAQASCSRPTRNLRSKPPNAARPRRCCGHTQKLEAVGQLTGGIAHDFNNLLAVIVGNMEVIRAAFESDGEMPRSRILRLLKASKSATDRATKLTQQLLAFARRSTMKFDVVALDEVIVGCEPFLRERSARRSR